MALFKNKSNDDAQSEIVERLRSKFRLVVINDETFEERFSLKLTPLNLFVWGGVSLFVLILLIYSLIAFTSLREYIPGYADISTRKNAIYATIKTDSLHQVILNQQLYIDNIRAVINGKPIERIDQLDSTQAVVTEINDQELKADSMLKKIVELEDSYNISTDSLSEYEVNLSNIYFYPPLKGSISNRFDVDKNHLGIDIVAPKNEAVKTVMDGTVIFASWTPETGHVIHVQHPLNIISIYKHNSRLLKIEGERVKAGEAIAIIGNTGELSTGPHVHFELWHQGKAVNPEKFIVF